MMLDELNRLVFEHAQRRDGLLWLLSAERALRDALLVGRDGEPERLELERRKSELRKVGLL